MKLYPVNPVHRISRVLARSLLAETGMRVEIGRLSPKITVINVLEEKSNGKKDSAIFLENKLKGWNNGSKAQNP